MSKVVRMKPARIIVLVIAVVACGIAALLAGRSEPPPPPPVPATQLETTDVLIASTDIGPGSAITEQHLRRQSWPAAAADTVSSAGPDGRKQIISSRAQSPSPARQQ